MAKKILSIVIGSEYTKVCEVSYKRNYNNKGIKVYRSITFPTPQNTIEDGCILNKDVFGEELRSKLREAKFKSDKVIFSVTSSKIANREVVIPPVKEKRIMEIIKTGAPEYFPIDMKDYILSYLVLEDKNTGKREKARQKKQEIEERRLSKKLQKQNAKALKKKSNTEIIAENMERMEAIKKGQASNSVSEDRAEEKNVESVKDHIRLSVYAAPSAMIKEYYNLARMLHFEIIAIDYSGNSSFQMMKRQANRGTNVFVQMNEKDTLISILRDDVLIMQRTVNYGISMLADTVIEQKYYRAGNLMEVLDLLKNRNLLTNASEEKEDNSMESSWNRAEAAAASDFIKIASIPRMTQNRAELAAKSNIMDSLHFLSSSIARMLDYYKSTHKRIDIDTIYLTGYAARIQGIEEFFNSEIGLTYKIIDKLYLVSSRKKTAASYRDNPSIYIPCLGAVIHPVGFIPLEFIMKKQKRSAVIGTVIFTLACIAGSASVIYVSFTDYQTARQELTIANNQLGSLPKLSGVHEEYDKVVTELNDLNALEDKTKSKSDNIKEIIEVLEKRLPKGTVINSMQFSETGITMNVTAYGNGFSSNALIAKILEQLKDIEYFKNSVDVSGISEAEDNGISSVNCTVTCTYVK